MKYPRTPHLPWSVGGTADDERIVNISAFQNKQLVMTEKLDGENTVMTNKAIHARSEDGYGKPWQTAMLAVWASFKHDIPDGFYVCGECLYAVHSIEYERLDSVFYIFGIFNNGIAMAWKDVEEWATLLGRPTVPIIGRGTIEDFDTAPIPSISTFGGVCEGYVIRNQESFLMTEFGNNVGKCVRKNHVQTNVHWTKTWRKQKIGAHNGPLRRG